MMVPFPGFLRARGPGAILRAPRAPLNTTKRMQLQIPVPYGRELKDDERIRRHLDLGWRISGVQRLSDQEILITFESPSS